MAAEFDEYSEDYEALLRDPWRERFAGKGDFFQRRKWLLLERWSARRKLNFADMAWLDVGCGRGDLLKLGQGRFRYAAGCDVAASMMPDCEGIDWRIQKSVAEVPFDAGSFDLVTAVCVFHHVREEDRHDLAAAMARTLKPGGWLCIIEHNPFNPVTQIIVRRSPVDVNAKLLTAMTARSIAKRAGLRSIATEFFLVLPKAAYVRIAPLEHACSKAPLGGQYAVFAQKRT